MEQLENNEIDLQNFCSVDVKNTIDIVDSASELPLDIEVAGSGNDTVEKGIFKVFQNIMYNQHQVDHYSCTLVSAFTALSNSKNVVIPLKVMLEAMDDFRKSGKFIPGVGAYLQDGAECALRHFNRHTGNNISLSVLPFTIQNAINTLKNGFSFTTGIKYGDKYFSDEQDDGVIQMGSGVVGNKGHAISVCKVNTTDDYLFKYVENYDGELKYQIILADFSKNRELFFNTMVVFHD